MSTRSEAGRTSAFSSQSAGLGPSSYAPIAQAFNKLSDDEREKLRVKFDIAYFIATENLPYTKYPKLCELETRHGVRVGTSYVNENAGKEFIHYIAELRRQELKQTLANAKFFSLLLDGSTDTGNIDDEVLLLVWCDRNGRDEKVHTQMEYFTVVRPQSVTAQGLFAVLESGLQGVGIQEVSGEQCKKLIGIGTDGASANIAACRLKGLVEERLPWVFWMWCMAHRLELAVKDALKGTAFDAIDEFLLRLYYLYEKSPKKCCLAIHRENSECGHHMSETVNTTHRADQSTCLTYMYVYTPGYLLHVYTISRCHYWHLPRWQTRFGYCVLA